MDYTARRRASQEAEFVGGEDEEEGDDEEGRQPRVFAHRAFVGVAHDYSVGCLKRAVCASIRRVRRDNLKA